MSITAAQVDILNKMTPDSQGQGLGTVVKDIQDRDVYSPIMIQVAVTADATSGKTVTVPYAFELVDVIVQSRATNSSATMTVKNGSTAITDAIAATPDTTVTRAATIDDSVSSITTSTTLKVYANGANDRALVTLVGYRA